ncbi:MAG TPA: 5'-nucleotidase, partial [Ilumatobacteraceae bacterium]|nr:5'-nucleotidase [Ilumatobacteraceae bacterium]
RESTLGNLVADALLDTLDDAQYGAAEIGVVNPGGLRNELFSSPDGVITYAEANGVLPFVNNLWTISLTGAKFKEMLEQQWQQPPPAPDYAENGLFLQLGLSDNVTYTYDPTRPVNDRILTITVDGYPMDMARSYRIGTFSFLAAGGDNFRAFQAGTDVQDTGLIDRDAWIAYLAANSPVAPDFNRQAVRATSAVPTTATAGSPVVLDLNGLNLTSLGSPQNTSVEVFLGGVSLGTTVVTTRGPAVASLPSLPMGAGSTEITMMVPNTVPSGLQPLQIVASPTNTTVTVPVTVTSPTPSKPYKPLVFTHNAPVAVPSVRLADTRDGIGLPKAQLTPFSEYVLTVAGANGVPLTAKSVAINVTALNSTVDGWVRVYPCGETQPATSTLNQIGGKIVANLAIVDIGDDGTVCIVSNIASDIVVGL